MIHIGKLKINLLEPEFFVNEFEKTVVCKLGGIMCLPIGLNEIWLWGKTGFYPNHSVIAVAKCSPEDTFDVDKGKRIALAKAEIKIYKYFDKGICKLVNDYTKKLKPILGEFDFFNEQFIKGNERYIDRVSNDFYNYKTPLNVGTTKYVSKGKKK